MIPPGAMGSAIQTDTGCSSRRFGCGLSRGALPLAHADTSNSPRTPGRYDNLTVTRPAQVLCSQLRRIRRGWFKPQTRQRHPTLKRPRTVSEHEKAIELPPVTVLQDPGTPGTAVLVHQAQAGDR